MQLTRALEPVTSPRARARGLEYYRSGAIVHFDLQSTFVYAVVRGGEDYVVRVELADRTVRGTCTCPFFHDRLEPCKHLWAVALKCDAERALQPPDTIRPADIIFNAVPLHDERVDDDWALDDPEFHLPRSAAGPVRAPAPRGQGWRQALAEIAAQSQPSGPLFEAPGQLLYVIDLAASRQTMMLVVHLLRQEQKQNGDWGLPKPARITASSASGLPEPDRRILGRLSGARPVNQWAWSGDLEVPASFQLRGVIATDLLPVMCETGRCRLALTRFATSRPQDSPLETLTWHDGLPLRPALTITRETEADLYIIEASLASGGDRVALSDVQLLLDEGIALTADRAFPVASDALMPWLHQLLERGPLRVPLAESSRLKDALLASGASDIPGLPEELRTSVIDAAPEPYLVLRSPRHKGRLLHADVLFAYGGGPPQSSTTVPLAPTRDPHVMARRKLDLERHAHDRLRSLGARSGWNAWERRQVMQIPASDVPRFVRLLLREGWHVEADGRRFRLASTAPQLEVRSGVDWFELRGNASFDDVTASLPQLLESIRRRQGTVTLTDGSVGILPEEWMRDFAPLALGSRSGDHLRFARNQVALLDALLAERPQVSWDERAVAARERLRAFDAIVPLDPPASFTGTLRPYQREALGWLTFLRDFGFGGCLADDMGLGKTVVVLALLEARRQQRDDSGAKRQPSLVVVPRSVLFNWQQEAKRFAPDLNVLDFSGADRAGRMHQIADNDLVLITYGTLRRDAAALADVEFDYVVLDEAQAIKNADTAGAKAARLLRGQHRLALSGTPVENRIDDLWSLFEFLNPGLLSGATAFGRSFNGDERGEELQLLARALRPFILRRTKEQVATELPTKTEQTIFCELARRQRALYNELRDHYRRMLLGSGDDWQRSKLQVLEALLRLRQAACHPALVNPERTGDESAKLELLLPRLSETIEEGHKALVFSQFTSFLALLREQLHARNVTYEYLDGRTRDREARVERFQTDPDCKLFLISLKAGGVGLNLTAADYVFILDPWWNPAAEAQAVDRAHRIGQTSNVFAYRLIARDTVEERVLELQQRKRELAEAIITADNSVVRTLRREDLELLLS